MAWAGWAARAPAPRVISADAIGGEGTAELRELHDSHLIPDAEHLELSGQLVDGHIVVDHQSSKLFLDARMRVKSAQGGDEDVALTAQDISLLNQLRDLRELAAQVAGLGITECCRSCGCVEQGAQALCRA
eukprot:COSAG01_NODE_17986_length_1108_cov_1.274529_1_plen_131_part_00